MALGDLVVNLVAKTTQFNKGISRAQLAHNRFVKGVRITQQRFNQEFARSGVNVEQLANSIRRVPTNTFAKRLGAVRTAMFGFASGIGRVVAALARVGAVGVAAIGGISAAAIKLAADAETVGIQFEVMTGSVELGQKLVKELRKRAAGPPFGFGPLSQATKKLLQFGIANEDVLEILDDISEVAAGNNAQFQSLSLAFGQVAANGRLMGQELRQFINAGFNPLQQIAEKTGTSMIKLRKEMAEGQISFEQIRQAFEDATSEGGRFFGLNERLAETTAGKFGILKSRITATLREIGASLIENLDMNAAIEQVTELANAFKDDLVPAVTRLVEELPKLTKILNEGVLGKGAGETFEKIAFTIAAIRAGMGPKEAAEAFRKIKAAERDAPFTNKAQKIADDAQDALDAHRRFLAQSPVIERAGRIARESMRTERGLGATPRQALENTVKAFEERFDEETPKFLREWFDAWKKNQFAILEAQESAAQQQVNREAFRLGSSIVRQVFGGPGQAGFLQNLNRALGGGPAKLAEKLGKGPGTLAAGSAEAFEVLRANTQRQAKQQQEQKKQTNLLKKANKALEKLVNNTKQAAMAHFEIKGLD